MEHGTHNICNPLQNIFALPIDTSRCIVLLSENAWPSRDKRELYHPNKQIPNHPTVQHTQTISYFDFAAGCRLLNISPKHRKSSTHEIFQNLIKSHHRTGFTVSSRRDFPQQIRTL